MPSVSAVLGVRRRPRQPGMTSIAAATRSVFMASGFPANAGQVQQGPHTRVKPGRGTIATLVTASGFHKLHRDDRRLWLRRAFGVKLLPPATERLVELHQIGGLGRSLAGARAAVAPPSNVRSRVQHGRGRSDRPCRVLFARQAERPAILRHRATARATALVPARRRSSSQRVVHVMQRRQHGALIRQGGFLLLLPCAGPAVRVSRAALEDRQGDAGADAE